VGRDEVVVGISRGGSGREVGRDVVVGKDVEVEEREREGEREREEGKDSGLIGL